MRTPTLAIFALISCTLLSCTDEPAVMVVHTGLVEKIDSEGALFTGSIQGTGTNAIVEYGFVWSHKKEADLNDNSFKVGYGNYKGEFEQLIRSNLTRDADYYVRSYAKTADDIVFGEPVRFTSQGSAGANITSFHPVSGVSNDVITIAGSDFSQLASDNIVMIGAFKCSVIAASESELKIKLPNGIVTSGRFKITVTIGETTTTSSEKFTLLGPILDSVNPSSAIQGTTITIIGEGFSTILSENIVKFNGTIAPVSTASPTQITVKVPPTNYAGSAPILVTVNGITGQAMPFTIEGPEIFSLTPIEDYPGRMVTITGKNFSPVPAENTVHLGVGVAKVLEASPTQLKIVTPFNVSISTGYAVDMTVIVTQKSFTKNSAFTPRSPWSFVAPFAGQARTHAASFVIGNKGYLGTGTFSANCACHMNDFWSYDPQRNAWEQKANFAGTKRYYAVGFSINGKGYIMGGYTPSGENSELWEYDTTLDQWTKKNNFSWGPVNSDVSSVVTIADKAYLQTGDFIFEYDATQDQWNPRASFPGALTYPPRSRIIFSANEKIYMSGDAKALYEYDPQSDNWTRKADVPLPDGGMQFLSFSVAGKGYAGIGKYYIDHLYSYAVYQYDPGSDMWQEVPSTHFSPQNAAVFVIDNSVYYGIGNTGDYVTDSFLKFNPLY